MAFTSTLARSVMSPLFNLNCGRACNWNWTGARITLKTWLKQKPFLHFSNVLIIISLNQKSSLHHLSPKVGRGSKARGQGQGHKKIRGQSQRPTSQGQTLSRPRTEILEVKNQIHNFASCLPNKTKKGFHKFLQGLWRAPRRKKTVMTFARYPYTSQKNISPKIICQKNIFLNFLFPELTFVRNHTCQNEHLPEITSARMNICLKLHLPEWTLVWKYICQNEHLPECSFGRMYIWPKVHFPENLFSRIYTCQNVHLAESTFPRKLIFQNLHLPECTFGQKYISPKTYFPELLLNKIYVWSKLHFPENLFFRNYIST